MGLTPTEKPKPSDFFGYLRKNNRCEAGTQRVCVCDAGVCMCEAGTQRVCVCVMLACVCVKLVLSVCV